MPPCPDAVWLNGYESDVFSIDTDEAFRALEMPQVRMIEETDGKDERPRGVSIRAWDAPFGGNVWEPGQVGGRQ